MCVSILLQQNQLAHNQLALVGSSGERVVVAVAPHAYVGLRTGEDLFAILRMRLSAAIDFGSSFLQASVHVHECCFATESTGTCPTVFFEFVILQYQTMHTNE